MRPFQGKIEQNLINAWNAEKRSVLRKADRKALALKFKNERLAAKLKETSGRTLVENDSAADSAMHADLLMELRKAAEPVRLCPALGKPREAYWSGSVDLPNCTQSTQSF